MLSASPATEPHRREWVVIRDLFRSTSGRTKILGGCCGMWRAALAWTHHLAGTGEPRERHADGMVIVGFRPPPRCECRDNLRDRPFSIRELGEQSKNCLTPPGLVAQFAIRLTASPKPGRDFTSPIAELLRRTTLLDYSAGDSARPRSSRFVSAPSSTRPELDERLPALRSSSALRCLRASACPWGSGRAIHSSSSLKTSSRSGMTTDYQFGSEVIGVGLRVPSGLPFCPASAGGFPGAFAALLGRKLLWLALRHLSAHRDVQGLRRRRSSRHRKPQLAPQRLRTATDACGQLVQVTRPLSGTFGHTQTSRAVRPPLSRNPQNWRNLQ